MRLGGIWHKKINKKTVWGCHYWLTSGHVGMDLYTNLYLYTCHYLTILVSGTCSGQLQSYVRLIHCIRWQALAIPMLKKIRVQYFMRLTVRVANIRSTNSNQINMVRLTPYGRSRLIQSLWGIKHTYHFSMEVLSNVFEMLWICRREKLRGTCKLSVKYIYHAYMNENIFQRIRA